MTEPINCGCGGEAKLIKYTHRPYYKVSYYVRCKNCRTRTQDYCTEAEAIEAWNKAMSERTAKVHDYFGCERCAECENPVFEDDEFCSGCGARLEWE